MFFAPERIGVPILELPGETLDQTWTPAGARGLADEVFQTWMTALTPPQSWGKASAAIGRQAGHLSDSASPHSGDRKGGWSEMGRSAVQPGAQRPLARATGTSLLTLRHLLVTQPVLQANTASPPSIPRQPKVVLLLRGHAEPLGAERRDEPAVGEGVRGDLSEQPTPRLSAGAGAGETQRDRALRAKVTPVGRRGSPS